MEKLPTRSRIYSDSSTSLGKQTTKRQPLRSASSLRDEGYYNSDKENCQPARFSRLKQRHSNLGGAGCMPEKQKHHSGLFDVHKIDSDIQSKPYKRRLTSQKSELDFNLHRQERARSGSNDKKPSYPQSRRRQQAYQIDFQRPLKLVQNANHVQVGTIMYSQNPGENKVNRKFIPIFPFFYNKLNNGQCVQNAEFYMPQPSRVPIPLIECKKKDTISNEDGADKNQDEGLQAHNLPTKANLRFNLENDPLWDLEDTRKNSKISQLKAMNARARYICELEIINFKSVMIFTQSALSKTNPTKKSRAIDVRMYVSIHKPCTVYKIYPEHEQKPQEVRSPFRLSDDQCFLNYWNLHQVFYVGGSSFQDSIDRFIDVVRARNPLCKIKIQSGSFDEQSEPAQETEKSAMPISLHMNKPTQQGNKVNINGSVLTSVRELMARDKKFAKIMSSLRLPILFSLLALLSQDKVNLFNDSFIDLAQHIIEFTESNLSEENAKLASAALDQIIISEVIDYKKEPNIDFITLFHKHLSENSKSIQTTRSKQDQLNYMKQRRLIVTPTLNYFQVEVEDETCLALRKFREHISRFVRITFANEVLTRGFYQQQMDGGQSLLLGFIHSIMKNGLVIYSPKYIDGELINPGCALKFLSYSNSQIKRHSAWFLAGPIDESVEDLLDSSTIILSMGEFDFEKNILKQYARRGQCFSTAKFITELHQSEILQGFPDIKRNGYTFTDGCGYISLKLATLISDQFGLSHPASAFQIRIGGAKGVLMVKNDSEMRVVESIPDGSQINKDYQVILRDSQIKFHSEDLSLNVVRCATYSQGFLNRQLVVLLSSLAVPDQVFLDLQREAKQMATVNEIYKKLLTKTAKVLRVFKKKREKSREACAQELNSLMKLSIGPSKWFQDTMKEAFLVGYEIQKDPIMSSILYTMQLSQLICLKKKARILVKDSCVLIGVVDDLGLLAPNEIFCQIKHDSLCSTKSKKKQRCRSSPQKVQDQKEDISDESFDIYDEGRKILEGKVLVSRNPCTHPGDIRLLQAVDIPELQHLHNVIVFPSTGLRPLCNMMAGGDLDGDVYFVCWDERIVSHLDEKNVYPPAKYTKPDMIKEKPAEENIADYFTFFLERDVLGQIANLHLNLCDFLGKYGPKDPKCIELSGLQSVAVDFAKHGECVPREQFSEFLKMIYDWPDFFEKKTSKKVRESAGPLGLLYRDLSNEDAYKDYMRNQFKFQVLLGWELDQRILTKASSYEQLFEYLEPVFTKITVPMERHIRSLMFLFRQLTESALFASDLKFHISSQTTEDIQSSFRSLKPDAITGAKPDEALSILNMKLTNLVKSYKLKLRQLIEELSQTYSEDINIETNVYVALYFASYFHAKNKSCITFLTSLQCHDNKNLLSFLQVWRNELKSRQVKVKSKTQSKLIKGKFEDFLEEHQKIEECAMTNPKKIQEAIELKKVFSVPWLLASEKLFPKQDFLARVFSVNTSTSKPQTLTQQKVQRVKPHAIPIDSLKPIDISHHITSDQPKMSEAAQISQVEMQNVSLEVEIIEIDTSSKKKESDYSSIVSQPMKVNQPQSMQMMIDDDDIEMIDLTSPVSPSKHEPAQNQTE